MCELYTHFFFKSLKSLEICQTNNCQKCWNFCRTSTAAGGKTKLKSQRKSNFLLWEVDCQLSTQSELFEDGFLSSSGIFTVWLMKILVGIDFLNVSVSLTLSASPSGLHQNVNLTFKICFRLKFSPSVAAVPESKRRCNSRPTTR